MDKKTFKTAAFCPGCGSTSQIELTFDVVRTDTTDTMISWDDIQLAPTYCENCNRKMIQVDPLIVDLISDLNMLGYVTRHSCEGHWRHEIRLINMKTDPKLHEGYELHIPYLDFRREDIVRRKFYTLYDTAKQIQEEFPQWNIKVALQHVKRHKRTGELKIFTIVPKNDNDSTWDEIDKLNRLSIWIGSRSPKELENIESYDELGFDLGQNLALDMTQNFYQFTQELIKRLSA